MAGLRSQDRRHRPSHPGDAACIAQITERTVTSNVGQSYPYSSEPEADRARRVAALVREREGLAAKLGAETTPLDANDRWWVWKCPTAGCPGLLHVAGYARDLHALFVVCDGPCSRTYLR